MRNRSKPAPAREPLERFVALGALPLLVFTRDATDAAVFSLGLMGGVALAVLFRGALPFLGATGRCLSFLSLHSGLVCLFAVAVSRFFALENDGFFLLVGNGMAFTILEAHPAPSPGEVAVGTSAVALLLFLFGALRGAVESGGAALLLGRLSPFETALLPAWVALFLLAVASLLRGRGHG